MAEQEDFVDFSGPAPAAQTEAEADEAETSYAASAVPWLSYALLEDTPALSHLHNEIAAFAALVAPSEAEEANRAAVVEELRACVTACWPRAAVEVFGSSATGLCLPSSDVDCVVFGAGDATRAKLNELALEIRRRRLASAIEVIASARVPIIKFTHQATGVEGDICFNQDGGLQTAKMMRGFMDTYPPVKPLVLVLKHFLAQRALNVTFQGASEREALPLRLGRRMPPPPRSLPPQAGWAPS